MDDSVCNVPGSLYFILGTSLNNEKVMSTLVDSGEHSQPIAWDGITKDDSFCPI